MPIGRGRIVNPLGHSGQRKLQDVVGSKIKKVCTNCIGFLKYLVR